MLQVSGNMLQQVGKFKYLGVVFASVQVGTKIATRIELSVFKSVFVPILTCGHESWVTTERILFQVQVAEMGFLRRVHGVTLRDKVRSCQP